MKVERRDRLHPGRGARLPGPAGRHGAQRPPGRGDEEAHGRQYGHGRARGADEELDGLRRPGHGAVHEADDGRGAAGSGGAKPAMSDTIFALATAPGRAAVAVVRHLRAGRRRGAARRWPGALPAPRRAGAAAAARRATASRIDRGAGALVPGPGQLHRRGRAPSCTCTAARRWSTAVTEALLALGLRLAEPGEFTRRAFENGKLDLDQAEARRRPGRRRDRGAGAAGAGPARRRARRGATRPGARR